MKRYIGPFLKLLVLLAFLSRIDFVFGQASIDKTGAHTASRPFTLKPGDILLFADNTRVASKPFDLLGSNTSRTSGMGSATESNVLSESARSISNAFTLGAETGFERLVLKASPKAFSTKTDLSFNLKQGGMYKLEVLDMEGVVVTVLAEGTGKAGEDFVYRFKSDRYPAGAYIGRLITESEVTSVRFLLE